MKDKIIGLRKTYLDAIINIDIKHLASSLPSPEYSNFNALMQSIISNFNTKIKEYKKCLKTCQDKEKIKEYEHLIIEYEQKIKVCEEVYKKQYTIKS